MDIDSGGVPQEDDLISDEMLEDFVARFEGRVKAVNLSNSLGSGRHIILRHILT